MACAWRSFLWIALLIGCGGSVAGSSISAPALVSSNAPAIAFQYTPATAVLIAGQSSVAARPDLPALGTGASFSVTPPLPAGIQLHPETGVISGTPTAPAAGRVYRVVLEPEAGAEPRFATVWIESVPEPSDVEELFVSPTGSDGAAGTSAQPFQTIEHALVVLRADQTKHTLNLRKGRYVGAVRFASLGVADSPITIRSYPGERAILEATRPDFRVPNAQAWEPYGAGTGEYRSKQVFASSGPLDRAVFLQEDRYVRLLTYAQREDLIATNQFFGPMSASDPRPGIEHVTSEPALPRMPFTYFGPGVYFNAQTGRVHIRLANTTNGIAGAEDYAGETDPNQLAIGILDHDRHGFDIRACHHVQFRHLSFRYGGNETIRIEGSDDVTLDHVEVRASTIGINIATAKRTRILHSVVDGGRPPWTFRSDLKEDYHAKAPSAFESGIASNDLVSKTVESLVTLNGAALETEIAYSTFRNGHDLYFGGQDGDFHHNLIENMNDEALFLNDNALAGRQRIHDNVIRQVVSAVSFSGGHIGAGPRSIYRNVIDLRAPVLADRPCAASCSTGAVWRHGHLAKMDTAVSPFRFYQNTVLLSSRLPERAATTWFDSLPSTFAVRHERMVFNNIFRYFLPTTGMLPISVYPSQAQVRVTDDQGRLVYQSAANAYERTGNTSMAMFDCVTRVPGDQCVLDPMDTLAALQAAPVYAAVGWERQSLDSDSGLMSAGPVPAPSDRLRLRAGAPALGAGVALPAYPDPHAPPQGAPDLGALQTGQDLLGVGVNAGAVMY